MLHTLLVVADIEDIHCHLVTFLSHTLLKQLALLSMMAISYQTIAILQQTATDRGPYTSGPPRDHGQFPIRIDRHGFSSCGISNFLSNYRCATVLTNTLG
jgi:hypothetical protein